MTQATASISMVFCHNPYSVQNFTRHLLLLSFCLCPCLFLPCHLVTCAAMASRSGSCKMPVASGSPAATTPGRILASIQRRWTSRREPHLYTSSTSRTHLCSYSLLAPPLNEPLILHTSFQGQKGQLQLLRPCHNSSSTAQPLAATRLACTMPWPEGSAMASLAY